ERGRDGRFARAAKDTVQRIVVGLRDRIVLMIVAAGACDGEPQEASRDDVDTVVENVVRVAPEVPADRQKPARGTWPLVRSQRQLVGGELLQNELVVRQVVVERANHPVAVSVRPGITGFLEEYISLVVGIARDVQPVAPPTLAVVR